MNILYGFSNCSYRKYNELFQNASVMVLQQAQKYHSLMTRGLSENGQNVLCLSGLPINRDVTKSLYTVGGNDEENGVKYHYFGAINLPGLRQIFIFVKAFLYTLFKRNIDIAICDILNLSVLIGIFCACRLRKIPVVGIVTDVPGKLADPGDSISKCIDSFFMKRMGAYILLTQQMNSVVNIGNKPFVVIEGQVDSSMDQLPNYVTKKAVPKVLMYAGSIKKIYGIKKLTESFISANIPDWVLHVYGDGDFRDELIDICQNHPNIEYKGIKLNQEIVEAELEASMLVNPRPTDEEYVKYSFPSKNMEYLVSGTPVLTTRLPGIPDEYLDYIYVFDNETVDGMARTLATILPTDTDTLQKKGQLAKDFVLKKKNQKYQAEKVCKLLNELIK